METRDGSDICNPELRLKTQKKSKRPGQSQKAINYYYHLHSATNMRWAKKAYVYTIAKMQPWTRRAG